MYGYFVLFVFVCEIYSFLKIFVAGKGGTAVRQAAGVGAQQRAALGGAAATKRAVPWALGLGPWGPGAADSASATRTFEFALC